MLRLRGALDEEYEKTFAKEFKAKMISGFTDPNSDKDFVEFLYLNGNDKGWNWGKNGMTNAAFLHGESREYFRQYF